MIAAGLLIAAALLSIVPVEDVAVDRVDRVEHNTLYDDNGREVFQQLIFYDWDDSACRFQVRAWRLVKSPAQHPARNWRTGEWEFIWHDGDVTRRVFARSYVETWTQFDNEMRERDYLPKDRRRELFRPRVMADVGAGD